MAFLLLLLHCKIFSVTCAALCNLKIEAILLANTRKSLKFHRFELVQNLVYFESVQNRENT